MVPPDIRHPWKLGRFVAAGVLVLLRYSGLTLTDVPYWLLSAPAWLPYGMAFASFFLEALGTALRGCARLLSQLADLFDGRNRLLLHEEIARQASKRDRRELKKHEGGWPPEGNELG